MPDILEKVAATFTNSDISNFKKAYDFAEKAHEGQKRKSGEPFFVHPCASAEILLNLGMDLDTLTAALLHDVIEDTDVTLEQIERLFGAEVALLVDGVTKLSRVDYKSKEEAQAESLRKMLLAMAKDIRVILIKLADRLHNMRTLEYRNRDKQISKAAETLEIYAPLAHRLGMYAMKAELEDLSLRYLEPEKYNEILGNIESDKDDRNKILSEIIITLEEKIGELGIKSEIAGRDKHLYSIYRKMVAQNKSLSQIYDITAIRVIVDSVKDCYAVLGIVHTLWKPLPGRFKDFIAVPKANMYQSLHTTLIGKSGMPFEIQIRTVEMHQTAEYGIAAHWKYKEGHTDAPFDEKLTWLRQLMEWQKDTSDSKEFMEGIKVDFFSDDVFVFTPKGDVMDLIKGATPLDFAYQIHSAIGNKCIGAKVNGRIVPLDYQLKTGDIVEILTSSSSRGPSRDWIKIVKTPQAKTKIRQWFKKELKEENIVKGKDMLEKEAKRQGYVLQQLMKPEWLESIFKKYTLPSIEDMYASVGYGAMTTNQILLRLINMYKASQRDEDTRNIDQLAIKDTLKQKEEKLKYSTAHGVKVKGEANMLVRFARCCNPVPGDTIVGYITRGRGVSVHRNDCNNLADLNIEHERFIDVSWIGDAVKSYDAQVQIIAVDHKGLFMEITQTLMNMDVTMTAISAKTNKQNSAVINLTVEINDTSQLEKLIKALRNLPEIIEVYRLST